MCPNMCPTPQCPLAPADQVYADVKKKAKEAVALLIQKEREGELIDRPLVKNILGIFIEVRRAILHQDCPCQAVATALYDLRQCSGDAMQHRPRARQLVCGWYFSPLASSQRFPRTCVVNQLVDPHTSAPGSAPC